MLVTLVAVVFFNARAISSADIVPLFVNLALAPFTYVAIAFKVPFCFAVIVPEFEPVELSSIFIPTASPFTLRFPAFFIVAVFPTFALANIPTDKELPAALFLS